MTDGSKSGRAAKLQEKEEAGLTVGLILRRWRRRSGPSSSKTPAGGTISGATWTASTSTTVCGCEAVVTDPIDDVSAMWRELEADRDALWDRIRELSGYDLAIDPGVA